MANILYVEDDPLAAAVVFEVLTRAGHGCEIVSSGALAPAAIVETRPDMVITDMTLPGISGCELVAWIRRRPGLHWLPVMVLTGNLDDEALAEAMHAGANAVMTKAARDCDFVAMVDATFRGNALRRARLPATVPG